MAIDGVGRKKVDITRITGGLERKNLKTDQERSIFDAMDTDHNGILTDAEIKDFRKGNSANGTEGFDADGDGVITKSEAKKFIKAKGLKNLDIKNQDVIDFLKKYGEYSQNTASADITEEGIVVNYNDGSKKIINPETREYKIIKQDANTSATTATLFNADDVLQSEVIENGNEVVTTTFLNGNRDAVKSVVKENKGDNTTTVITYDATGQKIESEVITNNATNEVTTYNYENGIKKGKKVVRGTTETLYTIDGDNEVRTSMIENKGIDAKETLTTWKYNDDNTVTEDITCQGQNLHTVNTLNSENHRLTQTKEIDGATYNVEYDGQGNTTGIVIQRDETLKSLAEKFNCSVEDLKNLNEGVTFKPGQTIKVPTELEADDERLQNRKPADKIQAEIKHEQEVARQRKLARQRAEAAQLKKLGLINRKGAGQKITGAYSLGNGKGYREEQFTVIGQASFDRVIVRNKKGEIVVLSTANHKNGWKGPRLVLKTERVVNTETFRTGKKVKVGRRDVVITNQSVDGHGRMLAVDSEGREVVISGGKRAGDLSDRKILNNSYYQASNVADIYNDPKKREEAIKNGQMHISIVNGDKVVYTRGNDGRLWAFKIGENGKLLNQGAVNLNTYLDADARAIRSYLEKPQMRANDVRDIYNDPQKRDQAIKDGRMKVVDRNGQKFVQTRSADGNLWEFKVGAKGTLINEGIVNEAGEEEGYIRSFDNTPDISGVISRVSFSEMKGALDRVYSDDYSDTRDNFVTLSDGRTKVARTGLSPFEQYLIEGNGPRSNGRQLTRIVANAGGFGTHEATSAAIGRICAHEVNYELHGKNTMFGLINTTHEDDVMDALKLCTSPADRLAAERSIHSIHPEIEADEGSYMRGVIGDETGKLAGYRTAAVDRVIVSWIESGAYAQAQYLRDENGELKLDANGKPMLDPNSLGDQAEINNLIDRMMFAQYYGKDGDKIAGYRNFDDEDYRLTAHNLMSSIGNSKGVADYYVDEHGIIVNPAMECFRIRCADYVKANNLSANVTGEPPEETFIVNMSRSVNTRKLDLEHVEASNRMLYPESPAFINAEEAVLRTRETGNTLNLFQSDDPAVYEELSIIAGSGDLGGNVLTLNDALHQMKGNQEAQDMAIARAYVYGGLSMDANMASNLALRLADRIDRRSHGGAASGGLEGQEIRIQEEILFRELTARVAQNDPSQIKVLRTAIQNRNYAKGNTVISFESILKEAEQIGNATPEFYAYDETYAYNRRPVTDPAEIETLRAKYMESLGEFSAHVNQLGRDFQMKVDAEGSFSSFADGVRDAGNFGNTRREYRNVYRQTREMNRRLELAAQGLLRNSNGTVITFEQEAARCQEQLKKLAAEAESYEEAQEYTKMAIVLAPVVVATAPVSTTGVVATAVVAGGSTAVVEGTAMMIEHETAVTPTSTRAEVMTNIAVRATEDAAFGAAIPGAGKVIAAAGRGVGRGIQYVSKATRARRINRIRANRLEAATPVPTRTTASNVARGGDASMLDANKRRLVEEARADVPTESEIRAYTEEHRYVAPTEEQRIAIDQNNRIAAEEYADAHRLENLATTTKVKPQGAGTEIRNLENQIGGLNKKIRSLENRIKNARAGEDTSKLQADLKKLQDVRSKKLEELNALKNPTAAPHPEPTVPAAETPVMTKAEYDRSIIKIQKQEDIAQFRTRITNDTNLSATEKKQLTELLNQQEMKLHSTTSEVVKPKTPEEIQEAVKTINKRFQELDGVSDIQVVKSGMKHLLDNIEGNVENLDLIVEIANDQNLISRTDLIRIAKVVNKDNIKEIKSLLINDANLANLEAILNSNDELFKSVLSKSLCSYDNDDLKVLESMCHKVNHIENTEIQQYVKKDIARELRESGGIYNGFETDMNKFINHIENKKGLIYKAYINGKNPNIAQIDLYEQLDEVYGFIEDKKIQQLIEESLSHNIRINHDELIDLMDAINAYNGHYAIYKNNGAWGSLSYNAELHKYMKANGITDPKMLLSPKHSNFLNQLDSKYRAKINGLRMDVAMDDKIHGIRQYLKNHPDTEISNYLYDNYYVKFLEDMHVFSPDIINQCRNINEKYGVKVLLSFNNSEAKATLKYVDNELNEWMQASNGQAKLPPVMDFSGAKVDWYDVTRAYGQGVAAAFSESARSGANSFAEMTERNTRYAMRHEMTHTNDLKRGIWIDEKYNLDEIFPMKKIIKNGEEVKVPDTGLFNQKYVQEFRNAGISDEHISYAFNNTKEFIAVASEGNMSKYSPEFKQMLIDFGMPEWMFNMRPVSAL